MSRPFRLGRAVLELEAARRRGSLQRLRFCARRVERELARMRRLNAEACR